MSMFLNGRFESMSPYTPGEQPRDRAYVKLNANETSAPPAPGVRAALEGTVSGLGRYADPYCRELRESFARSLGVSPDQVFAGNGSDEALAFAFLAFFGSDSPVTFPDITYGFYHDYLQTFGIDWREIPLQEDFTLDCDEFVRTERHVVIANPNAPTGLRVEISDIERIVAAHANRLVIVDEAYVDYGNPSCVELVNRYANLIVVQTFSKSRNLAGAHIGFAIAQEPLIDDMRKVKFCFNPFNVSAPTAAIAQASIADAAYRDACVDAVIATRELTREQLRTLGFTVLPSHANFLFATHPGIAAEEWVAHLRADGILVRHFDHPRIADWVRITVGTPDEMQQFIDSTRKLMRQKGLQ